MGLLEFDSSGIILLAWHIIALVLPMLASILAVLTNSVDHMRKCIMYWILLSLVFLFEYASVNFMEWNIIEWIPYWSCVRLVVIFFCLVMLHFRGACLAYQGSARFLTKLLQVVIDRFHKQREGEGRLCKRETLLNVVNRYILEYGSRFLRRLSTASQKQRERQKHNNFQSDTKIIEREGENTAVTSKQVNGEEMTENGRIEIGTPPLMKTQQKWPCDACELTFPSRSRLHVHYQTSEHKSKIKSLENSAKDTGPSTSVNGEEMTENGWTEIATPPLMQTQQEWSCGPCKATFPSRSMLHAHYQRSDHKSKIKSLEKSAKDTGPSTSSTPASVLNFEETTPPKENRCSETPPLIQQELKCDPRGFSTPYQSRWNADILGSLHKTNLDIPESSKARDTRSSPLVQHKRSVSAPSSLKGIYKALEVEDLMPAEESTEKRCLKSRSKIDFNAHFHGEKHQSMKLMKDKSEIGAKDNKGASPSATRELNYGSEAEKTLPLKKEWRCDLCKVTTRCEKNLKAHFDGKKHQSKLLKQSKNGTKDRGPSPSATSELNHGNEAEKFSKESGSESKKLRESKEQGNAVWVRKGRDANAEAVKERRSGNLHEKKKMLSDDLQKPKLESRKTNRLPAEEDRGLSPSASKQAKNN